MAAAMRSSLLLLSLALQAVTAQPSACASGVLRCSSGHTRDENSADDEADDEVADVAVSLLQHHKLETTLPTRTHSNPAVPGAVTAESQTSTATSTMVTSTTATHSASALATVTAHPMASGNNTDNTSQASASDGVCVGGSMCSGNSDSASCENSIFGCRWVSRCDGYCSGSSMCSGNGQSECSNSIFGCTWTCDSLPDNDGICVGGSMCSGNHDASACVTSIFGCQWVVRCDGICSGSTMCSGYGQSECANSIFGCAWKCDCKAEGEVCGWPDQQDITCCGNSACLQLWGDTKKRCVTITPASRSIQVDGGICLAASQGDKKGGVVQLATCDSAKKTQKWKYDESTTTVKNYWDLCLHNTAGSSGVEMRRCDGSRLQRWEFSNTGALRPMKNDGKCLAATRRREDLAPVKMRTCDGSRRDQRWQFVD